MSRLKSFDLTEHFDRFVEEKAKDGRFGSESRVVQEGLRLLEERERRLQAFGAAVDEGEASGDFRELDWDAMFDEIEAEERFHQRGRT
ncbi:type II toxin-antitoxin system ParD family antitoxin [Jiella sp. M17.18]|uniref:type II toxin-antitoxin system ParD family antitoxin n=1 Tax=Jiella sp. M17.18 TaxID=3234247 RepID=UPI0034DEA9AC